MPAMDLGRAACSFFAVRTGRSICAQSVPKHHGQPLITVGAARRRAARRDRSLCHPGLAASGCVKLGSRGRRAWHHPDDSIFIESLWPRSWSYEPGGRTFESCRAHHHFQFSS